MPLTKSGHLGFEGVRVKLVLIENQQVMRILINLEFLRIKIPKAATDVCISPCVCLCVCVSVLLFSEQNLPLKYGGVFVHINTFLK